MKKENKFCVCCEEKASTSIDIKGKILLCTNHGLIDFYKKQLKDIRGHSIHCECSDCQETTDLHRR